MNKKGEILSDNVLYVVIAVLCAAVLGGIFYVMQHGGFSALGAQIRNLFGGG